MTFSPCIYSFYLKLMMRGKVLKIDIHHPWYKYVQMYTLVNIEQILDTVPHHNSALLSFFDISLNFYCFWYLLVSIGSIRALPLCAALYSFLTLITIFFRQKGFFVILLSYIRWLINREGCFISLVWLCVCGWTDSRVRQRSYSYPIKRKKLMKMLFLCVLFKSTPVLRKWDVVK